MQLWIEIDAPLIARVFRMACGQVGMRCAVEPAEANVVLTDCPYRSAAHLASGRAVVQYLWHSGSGMHDPRMFPESQRSFAVVHRNPLDPMTTKMLALRKAVQLFAAQQRVRS
ncbi:hypothetical protein HY632_01345 [Candidatus Uhrbacteria bacterium]|nr:hypothetical protein [Candidatus Uhrbacteria bacterium]